MKRIVVGLSAFLISTAPAWAVQPVLPGPQLLCHRTANEDVPENTLESLEQAVLLGCNVVELDLRRTLDGKIVLNHDGLLDRLTDGTGDAETSFYGDLQLRDVGSWMADRFTGMHVVLLEDVLRMARRMDVRLVLDMKSKDMGPDVLQMLQREGMLQRVQFNAEWQEVKKLYPEATDAGYMTAWVQPGVTAEQVNGYHRQGKAVVANFSANDHQMDLASMKAAVAAGVDGINVDFPRIGADAVGRPVEQTLRGLILSAGSGVSDDRVRAILQLARYQGFRLQDKFAHWLLDPDDHVSRAAALALVTARPHTAPSIFDEALRSDHSHVRANAAWALGMLEAPADILLPLLKDKEPQVLQQVLLALSRMPGNVRADVLLPMLSNEDSSVQSAAALALAKHQPEAAVAAISTQLQKEITAERIIYDDYVKRGRPTLTEAEVATITASFRCQVQMMHALSMIKGEAVTKFLVAQAFRPDDDFSQFNGIIAGFQLWDRIVEDPQLAVAALESTDTTVADRAEWMLVKAGKAVLPEVRKAMISENASVRSRAIQIAGWQGDVESLPALRSMQAANGPDAAEATWAIGVIESLNPKLAGQ
jgi:glycerophosphoryl diester phosphodiesterase/HEAT repeat protein